MSGSLKVESGRLAHWLSLRNTCKMRVLFSPAIAQFKRLKMPLEPSEASSNSPDLIPGSGKGPRSCGGLRCEARADKSMAEAQRPRGPNGSYTHGKNRAFARATLKTRLGLSGMPTKYSNC